MNIPKLRFKDNNDNDYPNWVNSTIVDILPMPKGRGFLDTNDTCLLK